MTKLHLDTDIGGDMDDMCALALLLKWPNLEITGVTTTAEENGRRAGYARYMLDMMGRTDVPVAAGADCAGGYYRYSSLEYPPDEENWPEKIAPRPGSVDDAIELLRRSIEQGAVVVGIGPFTNFRLLDEKYPGILKQAKLFLMGGYVYPIPPGYPQWDNSSDWNNQLDVPSAQYVLEHANPTLIPLTITVRTALRRAYLPRIAQAGPLGELIVRQAELHARMYQNEQKIGETCPELPRDIINFQHDPLACAIALGWRVGVGIESIALKLEVRDGWLYETVANDGVVTPVVTRVNAPVFNLFWLDLICW
jgi:inosine-uridine nucleoside N-ribohydrolase